MRSMLIFAISSQEEAGAIPTTTERAPSRAGPFNDLCTISDQMRYVSESGFSLKFALKTSHFLFRIVNLRERKSTTTRVIRSAIQVRENYVLPCVSDGGGLLEKCLH